MKPELEALARRAVACPRWRWISGMLRLRDAPGKADHGKREGRVEARDEWSYAEWPCLPDLTDPATLGCLLALVREAYNDSFAHVEYELGEWIVWATPEDRRGKYSMSVRKTEAEALVRALERSPTESSPLMEDQ
jgi:hypothetical protein